jgi:GxxExxY protein
MPDLIYKTEVFEIIGSCMEVYNVLGYGFLEVVYKDAMEVEFLQKRIGFSREHTFFVNYKDKILDRKFFADFLVFDAIIIEVKINQDGISDHAIAQTINYLKASGKKLGVIINFGKGRLEYKRVVL